MSQGEKVIFLKEVKGLFKKKKENRTESERTENKFQKSIHTFI